jgi:hypothetical protein
VSSLARFRKSRSAGESAEWIAAIIGSGSLAFLATSASYSFRSTVNDAPLYGASKHALAQLKEEIDRLVPLMDDAAKKEAADYLLEKIREEVSCERKSARKFSVVRLGIRARRCFGVRGRRCFGVGI